MKRDERRVGLRDLVAKLKQDLNDNNTTTSNTTAAAAATSETPTPSPLVHTAATEISIETLIGGSMTMDEFLSAASGIGIINRNDVTPEILDSLLALNNLRVGQVLNEV